MFHVSYSQINEFSKQPAPRIADLEELFCERAMPCAHLIVPAPQGFHCRQLLGARANKRAGGGAATKNSSALESETSQAEMVSNNDVLSLSLWCEREQTTRAASKSLPCLCFCLFLPRSFPPPLFFYCVCI